ncbi:HAD-like domain protein [Vibrio phage 1.208.B._10N.222.52.A7]|nr:HAD-like domain protein [Vibrio phage 1.208.B._10N.222.52.A7]
MSTKIVVWDLDGTLFDGGHRAHLIPEKKDRTEYWFEFNRHCADDVPIAQMVAVFKGLEQQLQEGNAPFQDIVFLTSRPYMFENETLESLHKAGIDGYSLYMREIDDHRSSPDFKSHMIDEFEAAGQEVYMAFDDDEHVVDMMRKRGIYAVHVYEFWKHGVEINGKH